MQNNKEHVIDILEGIRPLLNRVKVKRYTIRKMLNGDFRIRFKVPGNRLKDIYADLIVLYKPGIELSINFEHNIITITKKNVQNNDSIPQN
jgi:hypothetical protein